MHNKLVHFKCCKILISLILSTIISLTYVNKSISTTLVLGQNEVINKNYDFVKFDIDDWKKFSSENCLFVDIKGIIPRNLNPLRI